jgi:hypothetical protein
MEVVDADLAGADALVLARNEREGPALYVPLRGGPERELVRAGTVVGGEDGSALVSGPEGTFHVAPPGAGPAPAPVAVAIPQFRAGAGAGAGAVWAEGSFVGRFDGHAAHPPVELRDALRDVAVSASEVVTAAELWVGIRSPHDLALDRVLPAGASSEVAALAFDPSGEHLIVGENAPRLHVYRVAGVPERIAALDLTTLGPDEPTVDPAHFTSFGLLACSAGGVSVLSGRHVVWRDPRRIHEKPDHDGATVMGAHALSRDGTRILSSYTEIKLTTDDGREILCLPALEGLGGTLALSPDGRVVLTAETDDATNLAAYDEHGCAGRLRVSAEVAKVALDPFGCAIGWVRDGPCFRWDPRARTLVRWGTSRGNGAGVAFAEETSVVWFDTGLALVVDTRSGRVLTTIAAPIGPYVTVAAMSRDGALVALGDRSGAVHLHRARDGAWLATLSGRADGGYWTTSAGGERNVAGAAVSRAWRKR